MTFKSKHFKLLMLLVFSLVFVQIVFACMRMPTVDFAKTNSELSSECIRTLTIMYAWGEWTNESSADFLRNSCNLSDEDISTLKDFSQKRFITLEQSDDEYSKFLSKSRWTNLNIFKKERITSITREGRWTGYIIRDRFYVPITKC